MLTHLGYMQAHSCHTVTLGPNQPWEAHTWPATVTGPLVTIHPLHRHCIWGGRAKMKDPSPGINPPNLGPGVQVRMQRQPWGRAAGPELPPPGPSPSVSCSCPSPTDPVNDTLHSHLKQQARRSCTSSLSTHNLGIRTENPQHKHLQAKGEMPACS